MKKLAMVTVMVMAVFCFSAVAAGAEEKVMNKYFSQIAPILNGKVTPEKARMIVESIVDNEMGQIETGAYDGAVCTAFNQYGWILQVIHDIVLGKVLEYESCEWYAFQLIEETLIWCPATCMCQQNIWCVYHQYVRLKALIAVKDCQ